VAEAGLSESLGQAYPEKEFFEPGLEIFCPSMKLTNIKDILRALEDYALSLGPGAALDNGVPLQGAGLGGA
jgi:quinolinate synthase